MRDVEVGLWYRESVCESESAGKRVGSGVVVRDWQARRSKISICAVLAYVTRLAVLVAEKHTEVSRWH